ncbi:MAG TPA: hypothetical protein VFJ85_16495 [Acidimicrobiales bacterium]|nr:hypothetical protein [Acidimicrobiales bacterium]
MSTPAGSLAAQGARAVLSSVRRPAELVLASPPVAADGSVHFRASVPVATPSGVYLVVVQGVDPGGRPRALVAPVVVTGGKGDLGRLTSRPPGIVGCADDVKPTFPGERDARVVRDVAAGSSKLVIDGDTLDVSGARSRAGRNGMAWLVLAAIVAAVAVVVVRRGKARR